MKSHDWFHRIHSLSLLALLMPLLNACEMVMKAEEPVAVTTTTSSNTSTVYDCTNYAVVSEYNTKLDCETTTNANCSSKYVTFPNKLSATCFVPPVGWAACAGNTYNWIYTLPTLSSAYFDSSSSSLMYGLKKSLIGCESRKCKCILPTVDPSQSMDTFISSSHPAAPDLNSCGITNCGNYIYNGSINIDFPSTTTLNQSFNLTVPGFMSVLNPIPGGPNVLVSESISPTATLSNAPPGFDVTVYQDALCNSVVGAAPPGQIDASGNASLNSLPISASKYGKIQFYLKLSKGTVSSQCLDTGVFYYRVKTPVMDSNGSLIFPSKMALTDQPSTIVFSATEPAGVVYSCKADQTPDDVATGDCSSSLPGVVTFDANTGIFQWTPSTSAYGLYEVCVTGTQQATLAAPTSQTGKKCSVIQVISSKLVTNRLVRYYDAEFSDSKTYGHTLNSSTVKNFWFDLISGTSAILNTSSSRGFRFSNDSGWTESGAHALSMNTGNGSVPNTSDDTSFHYDYVDTGSITNELGSFTMDMWVNMASPPIKFLSCNGNLNNGSCNIEETGYGVIAQIVEPGSTSDSVRNGIQLFANYDNTVPGKFKFTISQKHAGITNPEVWNPNATGTYDFLTWYHVTISWRKSTGRLYFYVNGEYIGDKDWSSVDFLPVKAREVRLGAGWKSNALERDNLFSGKIANFRFYNGEDTTIPISNCSSERARFGVTGVPINCP